MAAITGMKRYYIGIGIMIGAIVLAIIMMAINGWVTCPDSDDGGPSVTCHVGMRTVKGKFPGGDEYKYDVKSDKCEAMFGKNACEHWYDGGTIILATGVIAFFIFTVSMVVQMFARSRQLTHYGYGSLFGFFISSGLMVLGIVLYAYKEYAGFSFILMTISGFCYFIGVTLIIGAPWDIQDPQAPRKNAEGH